MSIAGARPNFMKLASIANAVEEHNKSISSAMDKIEHCIVHTGQHYDDQMSQRFFDDLGIPRPDVNLEVGSASHAVQTARIMEQFEPVLLEQQPDILLVVGDVNSTIACTLVASKANYNNSSQRTRSVIAHVEAGLRSFDRNMPEEINRILTDTLSDFLFTTEESGMVNLKREGVASEKIHFVGNVMIDTLIRNKEKAIKLNTLKTILNESHLMYQSNKDKESISCANLLNYAIVTLHRPGNVDTLNKLKPLLVCIEKISHRIPIIFPTHPRTKSSLIRFGLYQKYKQNKNIIFTEPLGYTDFLNLLYNAKLLLTDSGGIQEETTFLQIPCITLRSNTERPVTVGMGTNYLVGCDTSKILETAFAILDGRGKKGTIPPLWDGRAGKRIIAILSKNVNS